MIDKTVSIYILRDPRTEQIKYVGKTEGYLKYRLFEHMYVKNKTPKSIWLQELRSLGLKPYIELVESCPGYMAQKREIFWINYYSINNDLLNVQFTEANRRSYKTELENLQVIYAEFARVITYDEMCKFLNLDPAEYTTLAKLDNIRQTAIEAGKRLVK